MNSIKLTIIGGGSSYTPELADGIIRKYNSFPVRELVLVDITEGLDKVRIIERLLERMFHRAGLKIKVWSTTDRREALKDTDFVISQFRAGGLDARSKDEKIPLVLGLIGQETTGAGGFANALRTIPIALGICRDMEEICPDAWLINFTNPSGIVTEAINRFTKVKCIGLCNVPINMVHEVYKNLNCAPERVDCRFAGLNHLSFIGRLYVDGKDILADQKGFDLIQGSVVKNIGGSDIPMEYMKALGFIPSPYLKYFYLQRMMLKEEAETFQENGTTRADEVIAVETTLFDKYKDEGTDEKPLELTKRGGSLYSEAAISLMSSIYNDTGDIQVVNVMNLGSIPELPNDAVIETNCRINRDGATPLAYGSLPSSIAGLVYQVKAYERLTIEAAIEGNIEKAIIALVNNPLVGDIDMAGELVKEIIASHEEYLGYFNAGGKDNVVLGGN